MRVIYEPSGRAAEYAELAVNLYRGCGHACDYCYAPKVLRMAHREFWDNPKPRKDILKKFERDCQELVDAGDYRAVAEDLLKKAGKKRVYNGGDKRTVWRVAL